MTVVGQLGSYFGSYSRFQTRPCRAALYIR